MHIAEAREADIPAWLVLAAEVEPLFGPMVDQPTFHAALRRNIVRTSAYCVRDDDGPPGNPLLGGLLFSPHRCAIGWLAVAQRGRRQGIGRRLVEHTLRLVSAPMTISVVTFGPEHAGGQPARAFYRALGFHPAEMAPSGPEGGSRQVFTRIVP